jgi:hypothetical protein
MPRLGGVRFHGDTGSNLQAIVGRVLRDWLDKHEQADMSRFKADARGKLRRGK